MNHKRILFCGIICFLIGIVQAQPKIPLEVIASGAGSTKNAFYVNHTIGQPVIHTFSSQSNFLSQGFQQGDLNTTTALYEWEDQSLELTYFPNPAIDFFQMDYETLPAENNFLEVYNLQGILCLKQSIPIRSGSGQIKLNILPAGTYILQLKNETSTMSVGLLSITR